MMGTRAQQLVQQMMNNINKIYINQYVNNVNYNPYGGDPLNPGSDNDMGYNGN